MSESRLARCRQPERNLFEAAEDGHCVVFAVACQHGAEQDFDAEREAAGHRVLYLTSDGERAVEDWVPGPKDDLSRIDRAKIVPESALRPTGDDGKRYATIVRRHPEV